MSKVQVRGGVRSPAHSARHRIKRPRLSRKLTSVRKN